MGNYYFCTRPQLGGTGKERGWERGEHRPPWYLLFGLESVTRGMRYTQRLQTCSKVSVPRRLNDLLRNPTVCFI